MFSFVFFFIQGTVKVFAEVLNADVNYKTVEIFTSTTRYECDLTI